MHVKRAQKLQIFVLAISFALYYPPATELVTEIRLIGSAIRYMEKLRSNGVRLH